MIISTIKIQPYTLNESGQAHVPKWTKKFSVEKIIDGIEEAAKRYLAYDKGELVQQSVSTFLEKVPGVMVVKDMPPAKQKIAYTKGIARNRFGYWDDRVGSILLENYVSALKKQGWDEEAIVKDFEEEVIPLTKKAKHWSEWKNTLEAWTEQIKGWQKSSQPVPPALPVPKERSWEDIRSHFAFDWMELEGRIKALSFIGKNFPTFSSEKFYADIFTHISAFASGLLDIYRKHPDKVVPEDKSYISWFLSQSKLLEHFNIPDEIEYEEHVALTVLSDKCWEILLELFDFLYIPKMNFTHKDADVLLMFHIERCQDALRSPSMTEGSDRTNA